MFRAFLCAALALFVLPCQAGTITGGWTENVDFNPYELYGESEYRDWALWGSTSISMSSTDSTLAFLQKPSEAPGPTPINPFLYPSFGASGGVVTIAGIIGPFMTGPSQGYYGGLSLRGEQPEGAGLVVQANLQAGESLIVWLRTFSTPLTITASGVQSSPVSFTRADESYGYATFTTSVADVLNVSVQQNIATDTVSSFWVGGAAIQSQPVPEPATTLLLLAAIPLAWAARRSRAAAP